MFRLLVAKNVKEFGYESFSIYSKALREVQDRETRRTSVRDLR
jgi:hypothetical protein